MIATYVSSFKGSDGVDLIQLHWIDPDDENKTGSRCIPVSKIYGIENLVPGVVFSLNIGLTSGGKAYIKSITVTDQIVNEIKL